MKEVKNSNNSILLAVVGACAVALRCSGTVSTSRPSESEHAPRSLHPHPPACQTFSTYPPAHRRRNRKRATPYLEGGLNMHGFNDIAVQFYTAGTKYSAAIQPYAVKLFVALLLIDILVTWIQFTAEGQLDASHFLGRLIKHILSGGFVYLMIVNAFLVDERRAQEFFSDRCGRYRTTSPQPADSPPDRWDIASTIFNAPANASLMTEHRARDRSERIRLRRSSLVCHHSRDAVAHTDRILSGGWWRGDPAWALGPIASPLPPRKATSATSFASAFDFSFSIWCSRSACRWQISGARH